MSTIKQTLRSMLYHTWPSLGYTITATRFRRVCRERFYEFQVDIAQKLYGGRPITILAGPFQGMRYINEVIGGSITPKWLGSYEAELHSVIHELESRTFSRIINVGSAEGYYAVGLALHHSDTSVHAFDVDPYARRSIKRLASINNAHNIIVGGYCTPAHLNELAAAPSFILVDIEGAEVDLLDPAAVPTLRKADILVEVHPYQHCSVEDVQELLIGRFESSHQINAIERAPRQIETWQKYCDLTSEELLAALDEHRTYPQQTWLFMCAKENT